MILFLAEVRNPTALGGDTMNTGHDKCVSTIHVHSDGLALPPSEVPGFTPEVPCAEVPC